MQRLLYVLGACFFPVIVVGQAVQPRPPVIDMHVHVGATVTPERALAIFNAMNVRYALISGRPEELRHWTGLDARRFLPALMYSHPNVYVDVAALQIDTDIPRLAYMRHVRGLVEARFGKRIMFGSDFPAPSDVKAAEYLEAGIDAILAAS